MKTRQTQREPVSENFIGSKKPQKYCFISLVSNFQSIKCPVDFVISPGLMRSETGGLADETYFSSSIISLK